MVFLNVMESNVQRLSREGVHSSEWKRLTAYLSYSKEADDIVCSAWKHAAVLGKGRARISEPCRTHRKHYGKNIKVYEYVPLLDERNINDQGIDANGAVISTSTWFVPINVTELVVTNATKTATATALNDNINATGGTSETIATAGADDSGGTGFAKITVAITGPNPVIYSTKVKADLAGSIVGSDVRQGSGNLYGSSRDIGTITGKLPLLDEFGGRKNRVGFTRVSREGELHKFGFFYEFTQESLDFDSDDQLKEHLARELMNGAVQLTEAVLQKDLLTEAGTVVYAGAATSHSTVTGEVNGSTPASVVSYENLQRLDQTLTDLRCPRQTKIITGSRYIDTKVIGAGRVMYVGSALVNMLKNMRDSFSEKVFIPVQHYADAGNIMNGEIGAIDAFRIVQVPEMLHWAGEGAAVGTNPGYRATGGKYDVYPMLVVGDESFTTIGFQSDGKTHKFKVKTVMPDQNHSTQDPYGETGFSSIKWYYGTLILRPERLAVIKTVAKV